MLNFLESPCFPALAASYSGGLCFATDIVRLPSGVEQRNANWSIPLRRYEISSSLLPLEELAPVIAFFQVVRGRWCGFRFQDPLESGSSAYGQVITPRDQMIGKGDGEQCCFQLVKTVQVGEASYQQVIRKPVAGSVVIAVEGETTYDVQVDTTTGQITFPIDAIPPQGSCITAGFSFDTPCRFDNDQLMIQYQAGGLGNFSVSLLEIRLSQTALFDAFVALEAEKAA